MRQEIREKEKRLFRDNLSVPSSSVKKPRKKRQAYFGTTDQSHLHASRNPGKREKIISGQSISPIFKRQEIQEKERQAYFGTIYQSHLHASRNPGKREKIISGQPISPISKRQEIQEKRQDYFGKTYQSHLQASRNPGKKTRLFRDNLSVPSSSVKKSRKKDKIISGQPISPISKRQEIQEKRQDYFGTTYQTHLQASRNPGKKTRLFRDNLSVPSSSVKKSRKKTRIRRNVDKHLPLYAA